MLPLPQSVIAPVVNALEDSAGSDRTRRKLRFLLIVGIILVAGIFLFRAQLFGPQDYEDCEQSAARTASSVRALGILVDACSSKFPGRRKPGGGYTYYDHRQTKDFDIAGPNPTAKEMSYIDTQYDELVRQKELAKQQADATRQRLQSRTLAAKKATSVTSSSIDCGPYAELDCRMYSFTARVSNNSSDTLIGIALGWVFISPDGGCPEVVTTRQRVSVNLGPGQTTEVNLPTAFDGPSSPRYRYCLDVNEVAIAP
jgi:hypothetical protein